MFDPVSGAFSGIIIFSTPGLKTFPGPFAHPNSPFSKLPEQGGANLVNELHNISAKLNLTTQHTHTSYNLPSPPYISLDRKSSNKLY